MISIDARCLMYVANAAGCPRKGLDVDRAKQRQAKGQVAHRGDDSLPPCLPCNYTQKQSGAVVRSRRDGVTTGKETYAGRAGSLHTGQPTLSVRLGLGRQAGYSNFCLAGRGGFVVSWAVFNKASGAGTSSPAEANLSSSTPYMADPR